MTKDCQQTFSVTSHHPLALEMADRQDNLRNKPTCLSPKYITPKRIEFEQNTSRYASSQRVSCVPRRETSFLLNLEVTSTDNSNY
jgi:hypothetical protein